ncbi:MAG: anaerobic ribonucleoside-triphosphate reductase [Promethearchaeota archaeon]|nr:MAG: anaerobic ribonucleoside-triphosphate reductase [Candidatus Lokiarchaeota archaeon]
MHLLPKVYRTEGDVVEFDPSKILESIIKETNMKEKEAKNITELVTRRIISSGIKFLSGPHIREIVCSILSEQHFEEERKLYTRIGMPLMDYEEILEEGLPHKSGKAVNPEKIHHWAANQIVEEYTLLRILDDEESKAHLYGDIHIHKLKYFDLRPLSQAWDPQMILMNGLPPVKNWKTCCRSGPAKNFDSALHHLAKWLGMTQSEFSGGQGFNFVNTFLAPYAQNLDFKEIKSSLIEFVHEINQLASVIGRDTPITWISCAPKIPYFLADVPSVGPNGKINGIYEDHENASLKIFNALTEIYKKGDYHDNKFDYPKHVVYLKSQWLQEHYEDISRLFEEIQVRGTPYIANLGANWLYDEIQQQHSGKKFHNFGTLQNISLNLPRYAYNSSNVEEFIEILREKMQLCSRIFVKKRSLIKKRLNSKHLPLCGSIVNEKEKLFKLQDQNFAFNMVGLNEAVKFLIGHELHENLEAFNLGKTILKEIKKECSNLSDSQGINYILQENFSTKVLYRFARLDLKHFRDIAIPQASPVVNYYTNSAHFNRNIEIDLAEKLNKQGQFHEIIRNGRNIECIPSKIIENDEWVLEKFLKLVDTSNIACIKFCN